MGFYSRKPPKTGLFTLPGALFKSGVALAQKRYSQKPASQNTVGQKKVGQIQGGSSNLGECTFNNKAFEGEPLADPFQPDPNPIDGGFTQCRMKCMEQQTVGNECKFWSFTKKPPTARGGCVLYNEITGKMTDTNIKSGDDTCW